MTDELNKLDKFEFLKTLISYMLDHVLGGKILINRNNLNVFHKEMQEKSGGFSICPIPDQKEWLELCFYSLDKKWDEAKEEGEL